MLQAVESEGLVLDTGWLKDGIWNYFGSFYGHAWLWLGEGDKAARTLYAFGNHASPLLVWREEQMPVGQGDKVVGDMPHNWASAEFIRLVRHSLVLERGNELHLFEAMPANWARPGASHQAARHRHRVWPGLLGIPCLQRRRQRGPEANPAPTHATRAHRPAPGQLVRPDRHNGLAPTGFEQDEGQVVRRTGRGIALRSLEDRKSAWAACHPR